MNDEGNKILNLVKETKKVYKQISLLLETVEDQMKQKDGWEGYMNTVTADKSGTLKNPEKWAPYFLFRFYTNDKKKNILAFVSILIDDDVDGWYKIEDEPLITAGYFKYNQGFEISNDDWFWDFAQWYKLWEQNKTESFIESFENWKEDLNLKKMYGNNLHITKPIKSWKCFGLPLVSITTSKDTETKIVAPLLNMINDIKN